MLVDTLRALVKESEANKAKVAFYADVAYQDAVEKITAAATGGAERLEFSVFFPGCGGENHRLVPEVCDEVARRLKDEGVEVLNRVSRRDQSLIVSWV